MLTARGARPIFAALGQGMLEAGWNGGGGDMAEEREAAVKEAVGELSRMPKGFREVISRSLEAVDSAAQEGTQSVWSHFQVGHLTDYRYECNVLVCFRL